MDPTTLSQIDEIVALSSESSVLQTAYAALRIPKVSGVLLTGPPGVGKGTVVAYMAHGLGDVDVIKVDPREVLAADVEVGGGLAALRAAFAEARAAPSSPTLLWLAEVEAIAPARDSVFATQATNQLLTQLLTLLDGVIQKEDATSGSSVLLVATSCAPNTLDPALRRPGRLDIEIALPPPDEGLRGELIAHFARAENIEVDETQVSELAKSAVGYVGADLRLVVRHLDDPEITTAWEALSRVRPSLASAGHALGGMGGGSSSAATGFESLAGVDEAVEALREALIYPTLYPDLYTDYGLSVASGVLLHGPPGTGKTSLVRGLASSLSLSFFVLSGASVYSSYLGEAEASVRRVFDQARSALPSLVFIDEIDTLVGSRSSGAMDEVQERVLSTLLTEMDGLGAASGAAGVLVVGATNRLDKVDDALLRPGRLGLHIHVPLPDALARRALLELYGANQEDVDRLVEETEGASGAEIRSLLNQQRLDTLRRTLQHAALR